MRDHQVGQIIHYLAYNNTLRFHIILIWVNWYKQLGEHSNYDYKDLETLTEHTVSWIEYFYKSNKP